MSWLFSRALVAEYSADICSDGGQSAQSNMTPMPQAYLWRDKTTAAWRRFPSGMTCEPLTGDRGEELLKSFRAAFHAKTSAQPEKERESTASGRDSGVKWLASLAKYDRDLRSWKTRQLSLHGGLIEFSETWPKWGMILDGAAYQRQTPSGLQDLRAWIIKEKGFGLWRVPTPTATDGAKWNTKTKEQRKAQGSSVRICNEDRGDGHTIGGQLNPQWVEWLMGWPIGWTDLKPLEMGKFQQWLRSHGDCLPMTNSVTVFDSHSDHYE